MFADGLYLDGWSRDNSFRFVGRTFRPFLRPIKTEPGPFFRLGSFYILSKFGPACFWPDPFEFEGPCLAIYALSFGSVMIVYLGARP